MTPVLHALRADPSAYFRKSVANLLRDASKKHPAVVLGLCRGWGGSAGRHTRWVIREGLKKLDATEPEQVRTILALLRAD